MCRFLKICTKNVYNSISFSTCLGSDLLASAVLNVGDLEAGGRVVLAQGVRALGLVADAQVESALLIVTVVADRVEDVDELVVLGDPAALVLGARADVAHAVGGRERQLAVVHEVLALVGIDEFVVHGDATAGVRLVLGRLAKGEVVPGVVRDVVGTTRLVNLQEVDAAALVRDLDANVIAVDTHGPVGNTVGVDLASDNTDGGRVLLVGSDASTLATLGDGAS